MRFMRPAARAQATDRGGWRRSWRSLDMRSTHCSIRVGLVVHWLASSNIQAARIRAVRGSRSGSGRPTARYGVGLVAHWPVSLNIQAIRVRAVRGSRSGSGRPTARCGVGLVVHWLASSNIQTARVRAVRGSRSGSGRPTARCGTRSGRTGWRHQGPARRSDGHRR